MTHPITPPPDLVQRWADWLTWSKDQAVFTRAAQWGADQELEACCKWLGRRHSLHISDELRHARRPKPPTMKEQAYDALDTYIYGEPDPRDKERTYNTIRKALEALPQ
jgi:hypothetical protein